MERDPRRAARCVEKSVENWPVGDGVGAVLHRFRLAERGGDAAGVEVVATDDDRCRQLAARNEIVEGQAESRSIALPEPANARGETLKVHLLARELDPAPQVRVIREELEHQFVRPREIALVTGERN